MKEVSFKREGEMGRNRKQRCNSKCGVYNLSILSIGKVPLAEFGGKGER